MWTTSLLVLGPMIAEIGHVRMDRAVAIMSHMLRTTIPCDAAGKPTLD